MSERKCGSMKKWRRLQHLFHFLSASGVGGGGSSRSLPTSAPHHYSTFQPILFYQQNIQHLSFFRKHSN